MTTTPRLVPCTAALLLAACPPSEPEPLVLATQNAGTTTWLDLVATEPPPEARQVCADWYDNNLCRVDSEAHLATALDEEAPDLILLQEVWDQSGCAEPTRPDEVDLDPYACSAGSGPQLERVLHEDHDWACAAGYPDNCVAFRRDLFEPDTPCDGRDCSAQMVSNPSPCGPDGRIAWLPGSTEAGAAIAVVVHASAGVGGESTACRADQLRSATAALASEPPETRLFVAGDFNFDPTLVEGDDATALTEMIHTLDLVPLVVDAPTHRISLVQLDHVLVRAPELDRARCTTRFVDDGEQVTLFDHALVTCRVPEVDPER